MSKAEREDFSEVKDSKNGYQDKILKVLENRVMSPREIAEELGLR